MSNHLVFSVEKPQAYRLEFTSAWGVSTGVSTASQADDALLTDRDGKPFVPGSQLFGLLKDAALRVALTLDEAPGSGGGYRDFVNLLLGSPATDSAASLPSCIGVSSAHLPKEEKLQIDLKPGIAVEADTGRVKDDMLYLREVAPASVLSGSLRLLGTDSLGNQILWDEDSRALASAIISTAVRLVEAAGSGRTRGLGRCDWSLTDDDATEAVNFLESVCPQPAPSLKRKPARAGKVSASQTGSEWVSIRVAAELRQDTLSGATSKANTLNSQDYILGSNLLAFFHNWLRSHAPQSASDLVEDAVVSGKLRVSNMYPQVNGTDAMPTPLVFAASKLSRFRAPVANGLFPSKATEQMKPVRSGFVSVDDNTGSDDLPTLQFAETKRSSRVQTAIDSVSGRALDGSLYSMNTIAAGQVFSGEVILSKDLADAVSECLPDLPEEGILGRGCVPVWDGVL